MNRRTFKKKKSKEIKIRTQIQLDSNYKNCSGRIRLLG